MHSPVGVIVCGDAPVVAATTIPLAQVAMGVAPTTLRPSLELQQLTPIVTDNSQTLATTAFVQAAVSYLLYRDLKPTHKTVADVGWILWVDGTIGGCNVWIDCFVVLLRFCSFYTTIVILMLTVHDDAGGATTGVQGVALAAFNAHCRMTLPQRR